MADLFTVVQGIVREMAVPCQAALSAATAPPAALAAALQGVVDLADAVASVDPSSATFTSFVPLLESAAKVVSALEQVAQEASNSQPQLLLDAESLLSELVSLLLSRAAAGKAPILLEIASVLGLASPASALGLRTFDLSDLPALISAPAQTVIATYTMTQNLLATEHGAFTFSTALFPPIARLLNQAGIAATYTGTDGVSGAVPATLAHAERALVLPFTSNGSVGIAATIELDSAGNPVLAVSPVGTGEAQASGGAWSIDAKLGMSAGPVLVGLDGISDPAEAGVSIDATVTMALKTAGTFATNSSGTRVVLGGVHLALTASVTEQGWTAGIELGLDSLSVAVSGGDSSDGFVSRALAGGQQSGAQQSGAQQSAGQQSGGGRFAIGWDRKRGLYLGTGTGLSLHIPLTPAGSTTSAAVTVGLSPSATAIDLSATLGLTLSLGPVQFAIDKIGPALTITTPGATGNLGVVHLDTRIVAPTLIAVGVTAPSVSGSGFLATSVTGYTGAVSVQIGPVSLSAIGMLTVRQGNGSPLTFPDGQDGYSLVVIIVATFPPIQLGLGFALSGLGGMLGWNRTVNVNALRSGVRSKALDALLFPSAPAGRAAQIVSALGADFPVDPGRLVVGPMAQITWSEPVIATIDLAILIELPDPVAIIILGRLRIGLPQDDTSALVKVNLDAAGVIDLGQGTLSLDATIYDSKIGDFALSGDMALRMTWKGQRSFLLSIGGWHPAFTPPPGFPALRRITLALSSGNNPQLTLAAYFAVTSNTVQFGARADLKFAAAGALLTGSLGLDTLINIDPLGLRVDFAASVAVSFEGVQLLAVALSGTLTGPAPWHIHGQASFTVLAFSAHVSFDSSFGTGVAVQAAPAPVSVIGLLAAEVAKAVNWLAHPAAANGLLHLRDAPAGQLRVHPLATLSFHQRVAPLGVAMSRFGPADIDGPTQLSVTGASVAGTTVNVTADVVDDFAPANFTALTDAQKLSSPSFVSQQAGVTLNGPTLDYDALGGTDVATLTPTLVFLDPGGEPPAGAASAAVAGSGPAIARPATARAVLLRPRAARWPGPAAPGAVRKGSEAR